LTIAALSLIALLVLVHRPLLVGFARSFRVDDPAPSDAMLILVGSPDEPAEIYRRGWAPQVLMVPSGQIPFPDLNPFEVVREVMIRRGIPPKAMRILPPVRYGATIPEIAQRVREELEQRPIRRLLIAANAQQTARVRRIFRHALRGLGVEIHMAAVRNPMFDEATWYQKDEGLAEYFKEVLETFRSAF
jgi:hypothetical protein